MPRNLLGYLWNFRTHFPPQQSEALRESLGKSWRCAHWQFCQYQLAKTVPKLSASHGVSVLIHERQTFEANMVLAHSALAEPAWDRLSHDGGNFLALRTANTNSRQCRQSLHRDSCFPHSSDCVLCRTGTDPDWRLQKQTRTAGGTGRWKLRSQCRYSACRLVRGCHNVYQHSYRNPDHLPGCDVHGNPTVLRS